MKADFVHTLVRALAFAAPAALREALVGDLLEEFHVFVRPGAGAAAAGLWLLRQLACSLPPLLLLRWRRFELQPLLAAAIAAPVAGAAADRLGQALWTHEFLHSPLCASPTAPAAWRVFFAVFAFACALGAALLVVRLLSNRHRRLA